MYELAHTKGITIFRAFSSHAIGNLFLSYANNKGADQRMRRLTSIFVVRCLDSILPLSAIAELSRP